MMELHRVLITAPPYCTSLLHLELRNRQTLDRKYLENLWRLRNSWGLAPGYYNTLYMLPLP